MPRTMLVTIGKDLTLAGTLSPVALGEAKTFTLTPVGGALPYTTTVESEDLPPEWTITVNGDGSVDIETTDADFPGEFTMVFRLEDGDRDERLITRRFRVIALPLIVSGTLPDMTVGVPYAASLPITGGVAPYTLPYVIGAVAGVSVSVIGTNVVYSGTPTGAFFPPGYSFAVPMGFTVQDDDGAQADFAQTVNFTITPMAFPGTYADATKGVPYAETITASGGVGAITYTLQTGTIPAGTSLNPATGAITGTPTTIASYTFTIRATDANGNFVDSSSQNVAVTLSILALMGLGPVYIAHRGASLRYPEQTTVAYAGMQATGHIVVEQDIRTSASGTFVVSHDADATFTTTSSANFSTLSAASIAGLTVDENVWFGVDYTPIAIPMFSAVLNAYADDFVFFPEIKDTGGTQPVNELLAAGIPVDQAVVVSGTVAWLAQATAAGYTTMLQGTTTDLLATVAANNIDFVSYDKAAPSARFTAAVSANVPVWAYTVNRRHQRDTLLGYGVSGMYSDDPEYLAADTPFATTDAFAAPDWMPGMIPNKATNETRPTAAERGRFSSPDYWGFTDSGVTTYHGVLQGWACPIDSDPSADDYQIDFKATFGAPSGGDQTRWAGLFVSDTDAEFMDVGTGNVSPDGYHFLARKTGALAIYRLDGPNTATQLAENEDGAAIADNAEIRFRSIVTPTKLILQRLDGSGNVVHSVTAGDTTAGHRGGYFHLGHSRLPMKFRDVSTAAVGTDPWTPFDLAVKPKLILSEDSPITLVSSVVSQWNDISGNGYNVTQATAADRPTPIVNSLNDHRVVDFDATDYLDIPSGAYGMFNAKAGAAALVVYRQDVTDGAGTDRILVSFATNAAASRFAMFSGTAAAANKASVGGRRLDADSFFSATSATARSAGAYVMALGVINYSTRVITLYIDGAQDAQTTGAFSAGGNTSATNSLRARVGAGVGTTAAGFANGKRPMTLVLDYAPNSTEIDKLFGWAAHKYGLTANLPALHPYKTTPP